MPTKAPKTKKKKRSDKEMPQHNSTQLEGARSEQSQRKCKAVTLQKLWEKLQLSRFHQAEAHQRPADLKAANSEGKLCSSISQKCRMWPVMPMSDSISQSETDNQVPSMPWVLHLIEGARFSQEPECKR